jgi:hypothetical protein
MRSSRVIGLFVVVALLVAPVFASVTPSKVCHPKKPVTCRATVLADQSAKPAVKAQPVQQAMVCGYFPRWVCRADTLNSTKPAVKAQPVQQAMVCGYFPRWVCRANTLS